MRHINLSGSFMNDYCMLFLMAFVHQSIKRFGYLLTYMSLSAPIPHTLLLLLTFSLSIADRDTPDTRLVNRGSVDAMYVMHCVKSAAAATAADKMLQTETGTVQHETDRRKVVVDNNSWNRKNPDNQHVNKPNGHSIVDPEHFIQISLLPLFVLF